MRHASSLDRAIATRLADREGAVALLAALAARGDGRCLDDDALAAVMDGGARTQELAHLIGCATCRELLDELDAVLAVETITAGRRAAPPELPAVALAACVRADDDAIEVLRCTGTTRVQGALAVRSDRGLTGVSLRDASDGASLELALLPGRRAGRWSLVVRWLVETDTPLLVRASRDGRVLAQDSLRGGSAVLDDLRRSDVRVDVLDGNHLLGTAWLEVAP